MNLKDYIRPGDGAADITPLLADKDAFHKLVTDMSEMFSDQDISAVVCIEGRGFLLGSATAFNINASLIPVRYPGKLKNDVYSEKYIDYSGKEKELQIHKDAIKEGARVLIVDDWLETGSTVKAAIELVKKCGGNVAGVGVFMDDSSDEIKQQLSTFNYKYLEKVLPEDNF